MAHSCTRLEDFLLDQKDTIEEHIDRHKYYKHIPDKDTAYLDFIKQYGPCMRAWYCAEVCTDRIDCSIAKQYIDLRDSIFKNYKRK